MAKSLVLLSVLLTIIIASNKYVNAIQTKALLIPDKTVVGIFNKVNGYLLVHCKDKNHDFGPQTLNINQEWSFKLQPDPFWPNTLYYCSFEWGQTTIKYFDIYKELRDKDLCTTCNWNIFESGPCRFGDNYSDCYHWDNPSIVSGDNNQTTVAMGNRV